MAEQTEERERYAQYPNTILEFDGPAGPRIDLRRPLDAAQRDALAALGLGTFGVFTAENPEGEHAEDEPSPAAEAERERENARRMQSLLDTLDREGTRYARVDGVAPDGDYREHCVAIAVARDRAVAMAERFDQLALFWFDGRDFWLLPAEADQEARRLPE
jgi:hypothetical protein